MNQEDILKLAEENCYMVHHRTVHTGYEFNLAQLTRFAELVAQHENEACATLIQDYAGNCVMTGYEVAKKIRARSKP